MDALGVSTPFSGIANLSSLNYLTGTASVADYPVNNPLQVGIPNNNARITDNLNFGFDSQRAIFATTLSTCRICGCKIEKKPYSATIDDTCTSCKLAINTTSGNTF
jgi:hypothetical protein